MAQENTVNVTSHSLVSDGYQSPCLNRSPQPPVSRNNFTFGKTLGLGSYSKVLQAFCKSTGQEVALKIMDKRHIVREKKVEYVKQERQVLDQLDHPGVIQLYFTFQDDYSLYLGLECCSGGELFDQIRLKGRLMEDEARFYAAEIVDTLEYVHGQGVLHRDLKPENVLLSSDGHIKLADFGSAKLLRPLPNGAINNIKDDRNQSFVGTAEYVSPEVLNSSPVTPAADMWALGCILYQMLEGRAPFKAASEYLCFQKVLHRDFVMPPNFSPEARDLVNHLLELDPLKRFGSGPNGYKDLKAHPFFASVDWDNLRGLTPPVMLAPPRTTSAGDDGNLPSDDGGDDWELAHIGGRRMPSGDTLAQPWATESSKDGEHQGPAETLTGGNKREHVTGRTAPSSSDLQMGQGSVFQQPIPPTVAPLSPTRMPPVQKKPTGRPPIRRERGSSSDQVVPRSKGRFRSSTSLSSLLGPCAAPAANSPPPSPTAQLLVDPNAAPLDSSTSSYFFTPSIINLTSPSRDLNTTASSGPVHPRVQSSVSPWRRRLNLPEIRVTPASGNVGAKESPIASLDSDANSDSSSSSPSLWRRIFRPESSSMLSSVQKSQSNSGGGFHKILPAKVAR